MQKTHYKTASDIEICLNCPLPQCDEDDPGCGVGATRRARQTVDRKQMQLRHWYERYEAAETRSAKVRAMVKIMRLGGEVET